MINHTFVVLAYKDSRHIEECIESLLAQTRPGRICISTSTPSPYISGVAEKYKLPVHTNPGAGGIADDWSFAYSRAGTDFVTLAHQDDIYDPDYAASCLKAAEDSGDCIIGFTDSCQLQDGRASAWNINLAVKRLLLLPFVLRHSWRSAAIRKLILRFGNSICCPSVMYNKRKIGEFKFSSEYTYNLDWDAWIRLAALNGSFFYVNKRLILHRIHREGQTYLQTKSNRRAEEELMCLKRLLPAPLAQIYSKIYALGSFSNKLE